VIVETRLSRSPNRTSNPTATVSAMKSWPMLSRKVGPPSPQPGINFVFAETSSAAPGEGARRMPSKTLEHLSRVTCATRRGDTSPPNQAVVALPLLGGEGWGEGEPSPSPALSIAEELRPQRYASFRCAHLWPLASAASVSFNRRARVSGCFAIVSQTRYSR
jgi:hypothetical protein